jgi:hypothetical protein
VHLHRQATHNAQRNASAAGDVQESLDLLGGICQGRVGRRHPDTSWQETIWLREISMTAPSITPSA